MIPKVDAREREGSPQEEHPLKRFDAAGDGYRWEGIPLKHYKEEGSHFKSITRQTLFSEEAGQPCELRYFEIQPGGHSTFEKHVHTHAIVILRGRGRAIVAEEVADVQAFDLVSVPPLTWHQLQAAEDAPLGFLCQVPCERDRPIRPNDEECAALLSNPHIGHYVRL